MVPRAYNLRHPKKRAFLESYRQTGNVSASARQTGIARTMFYQWLEDDPRFAEAARVAEEESTERMEEEAHRRAVDGVNKPVFHQGVQCGTIREYSDTLMIFLLKARSPKKYRENFRIEASGPDGGPIQVAPAIDWSKLPIEKRKQLKSLIDEARGLGEGNESPQQIPG